MDTKQGLILFAHGARDPQWCLPFQEVAARVRRTMPAVDVELAFLEFMTPDLPQAAEQLVVRGATKVEVLPLFLGAGGHVRRDLPAIVETLKRNYPDVIWHLHQAAGESAVVIDALARAALHALQGAE